MYFIEHLNSLFTLLNAVPVDFVLTEHFMDTLFAVFALDLNFCILYVSMAQFVKFSLYLKKRRDCGVLGTNVMYMRE